MERLTRIVLIGGGHANIQVLKILHDKLFINHRDKLHLTLVTHGSTAFYSGMLPGAVAGIYTEDEISLDLRALTMATKTKLIEVPVVSMTPSENKI
jgi:selenide,water dikinase